MRKRQVASASTASATSANASAIISMAIGVAANGRVRTDLEHTMSVISLLKLVHSHDISLLMCFCEYIFQKSTRITKEGDE